MAAVLAVLTVAAGLALVAPGTASGAAAAKGGYVSIVPERAYDSRRIGAGGCISGGLSRQVVVTGSGFVPTSASAVALNVTVVTPTTAGVLTVFPGPSARPTTASLRFAAGQTVSNSMTVATSPLPGGQRGVSIFNSSGCAHVLVDVVGFHLGGTPVAAGGFVPAAPATRVLDTSTKPPCVAAGRTVSTVVAGGALERLVPASATAVMLGVSVVAPTASGSFTVFPAGATLPPIPTATFSAGRSSTTTTTVRLTGSLAVSIFHGAGCANFTVDVLGFFVGGAAPLGNAGGRSALSSPVRRFDSRAAGSGGCIFPGAPRALTITSTGGVPATAGAADLVVTVLSPTSSGSLVVYPPGEVRPTTTALSYSVGATTANHVTTRLVGGGKVLVESSSGCVQVTVDVIGFYSPASAPAAPLTGNVSTLAGRPYTSGPAATSSFALPRNLAADASGNIFVADPDAHVVRRIAAGTGTVSTFAGVAGVAGSTDGTGTAALLDRPAGLAVDSSGNLLVADAGSATIRRITPGGVVTTLAGAAGDRAIVDGPAASARFVVPVGIAVDATGKIAIADEGSHSIRILSTGGSVSTLAGPTTVIPGSISFPSGSFGWIDGTGANARFDSPADLVFLGDGSLAVADPGNNAVRRVAADGTTSTLAGPAAPATADGSTAPSGLVDGPSASARFTAPLGLAVDADGSLLVADTSNGAVRRISVDRTTVSTVANVGPVGASFTTPFANNLGRPIDVVPDGAGAYAVSDIVVKRVTAGGSISILAGVKPVDGTVVADGTAAGFDSIDGIAVESTGATFLAEANGGIVRRVSATGSSTLVAGFPRTFGYVNAVGSAARFNRPSGVAVDANGTIYVADQSNNAIRRINPTSASVTTFAGSPPPPAGSGISFAGASAGSTDGIGTAARFRNPSDVAVDRNGNVFVADAGNHTIRRITPAGVVTTLAGRAGVQGSADGTGTAATFSNPRGIGLDRSGNVFVADSNNSTIRRITPAGVVTTVAGSAFNPSGFLDGPRATAQFAFPTDVAVDAGGTLFVADLSNGLVRKVTATAVGTLAGQLPAVGPAAELGTVRLVMVDGSTLDVFAFPRSLDVRGFGTLRVGDDGFRGGLRLVN